MQVYFEFDLSQPYLQLYLIKSLAGYVHLIRRLGYIEWIDQPADAFMFGRELRTKITNILQGYKTVTITGFFIRSIFRWWMII